MPDQPVGAPPPEPPSPEMEGRVTRLETLVEQIRADVADLRQELREFRTEMRHELSAIRGEMATTFRWIIGLLFTLLLAMMGGFAALYSQFATILARLPK